MTIQNIITKFRKEFLRNLQKVNLDIFFAENILNFGDAPIQKNVNQSLQQE